MPHYGDYQNEIYFRGLQGRVPSLPVDFATLEARAATALPPSVLSYLQGGCGDELTQRRNASAFEDWGMIPRMMVDCSQRDLSIELLGMTLPNPLFMAPIGINGICTQDGHGDLAAARASELAGVSFMASTLSNDPLEAVAQAMGAQPGFFQLYTPKDEALAQSLVSRAEAAGYKAIVVTLDTWVTGWRPRDLNTANFPQLRGAVLANYTSDPAFCAMLAKPPQEDGAAVVRQWAATFGRCTDVGRSAVAALADHAAAHPQGHLPSRRCPASDRRWRGRNLLFEPRRTAGQWRDCCDRCAARRRRRSGFNARTV